MDVKLYQQLTATAMVAGPNSDGRVGLYAGFCHRAPASGAQWAAIHLGLPSPTGSSGLPAGSDGPSSDACADHRYRRPFLALLRVGFT